ncbi:MAG: hypothetical protein ACRDXB_02760 [Actinomycetes bacterium]
MTLEFQNGSGSSGGSGSGGSGSGNGSSGIPAGDRGKGPDNDGTLSGFRVGRTK